MGIEVENYDEGQEPLIYAVSTVETIAQAGLGFVFSDGHGIAASSQALWTVAARCLCRPMGRVSRYSW